jgi:3-phenylpropionate/trans-cinnamate dioxygenase ferredoxin reductase subunit
MGPEAAQRKKSMSGMLIVGAGLAGLTVAETLRAEGYAGPVTLLGAEPHAPYQRPPLSKGFLLGETARGAADDAHG